MHKSLWLCLALALPAFATDTGVACVFSAAKSGRKGVVVGRAGMAQVHTLPDRLYVPSSLDVNTSAGVNRWRSIAIYENPKTQTTTTNQPSYALHNGEYMARFDGSSDYLGEVVTYNATSGMVAGGVYLEGPGSLGGAFLSATRIETTNTYSVTYFTYNGLDPGSAGYSRLQAGAGSYGYDTTTDFDSSNVAYAVTWLSSGTATFCRIDGANQALTKTGVDSGQWFNNVAPNVNRWNVGVVERSSGFNSYFHGYIGAIAIWTNLVPPDSHKKEWERLMAAGVGKQIYP